MDTAAAANRRCSGALEVDAAAAAVLMPTDAAMIYAKLPYGNSSSICVIYIIRSSHRPACNTALYRFSCQSRHNAFHRVPQAHSATVEDHILSASQSERAIKQESPEAPVIRHKVCVACGTLGIALLFSRGVSGATCSNGTAAMQERCD